MVLINRVKYSCERCIRGHRVSGCRHLDVPLRRIKRKGRPTGQCSICRVNKPKGQKGACVHAGNADNVGESPDVADTSYTSNVNSFHASGAQSDHPHEGYYYLSEFTMEQQLPKEVTPEGLEALKSDPRIVIELPDGTIISGTPAQQQKLQTMQHQQQSSVPAQATPSQPGAVKSPNSNHYAQQAPPSTLAGHYQSYSPSQGRSTPNKENGSRSSSEQGYIPTQPATPTMFGLNPAAAYGMGAHHQYMVPGGMPSASPSPSPALFDERALLNGMPHAFNHLNVITHPGTPHGHEDYYSNQGYSQPAMPQPYMLNGPYTAALYNDSMGNNAASAAINLHGTNNYMPSVATPSPSLGMHGHHTPQSQPPPMTHSPSYINHPHPTYVGSGIPYQGDQQQLFDNRITNFSDNNSPADTVAANVGSVGVDGGESSSSVNSNVDGGSLNGANSSPRSSAAPSSKPNDLFSTQQELANSLPGIDRMNPDISSKSSKVSGSMVKQPSAERFTESMTQLSNLY